ncbi:MAG: rhodanese-related sulfurtransferase [Saprospiraceae bacterium]|nr:rhodanese-related sulfurtransferase [Saprospiraceae bacterium]
MHLSTRQLMGKKRRYNLVNHEILKQQMEESAQTRTTLSFYRYMPIAQPEGYRDQMYDAWEPLGVLGRIYVAEEGVNGQISLPAAQMGALKSTLSAFGLAGTRLNMAIEDDGKSFFMLKIKVRPKIVADGLDDRQIDWNKRGRHVDAAGFNALTDQPETTVVDMRNHYESEVGHFENAICPDVETFRESLPLVAEMLADKKEQPVVMYCTGGIRCEKASAYLKSHGFREVYQLDGGIIEYARQVEQNGLRNKFIGKNFVFDERMGERISDDVIARCHQCGTPADTHVNCANDACHILFIQCPTCGEAYRGCCSRQCAEFIALPPDEQQRLRKTTVFNGTKFGKGRYKAHNPASATLQYNNHSHTQGE